MKSTLDSELDFYLDSLIRDEPLRPEPPPPEAVQEPERRRQLTTLLDVARRLQTLDQPPAMDQAQQAWQVLVSEVQAVQRARQRARRRLLRPLLALASLVVVVTLLSAGILGASASALPGDLLYGIKRLAENVQKTLTLDGAARTALEAEFNQRRVTEVLALQQAARQAAVEFDGELQTVHDDHWQVDALNVAVSPQTQIHGQPLPGNAVHVIGAIDTEQIITADEIDLLPSGLAADEGPGHLLPTTASLNPAATPQPRVPTLQPSVPTVQSPLPTAEPAVGAEPQRVEFIGRVTTMNRHEWIIGGLNVRLDASTEISGTITPGDWVGVQAWKLADGRLQARHLELRHQSQPATIGPEPRVTAPSP